MERETLLCSSLAWVLLITGIRMSINWGLCDAFEFPLTKMSFVFKWDGKLAFSCEPTVFCCPTLTPTGAHCVAVGEERPWIWLAHCLHVFTTCINSFLILWYKSDLSEKANTCVLSQSSTALVTLHEEITHSQFKLFSSSCYLNILSSHWRKNTQLQLVEKNLLVWERNVMGMWTCSVGLIAAYSLHACAHTHTLTVG